ERGRHGFQAQYSRRQPEPQHPLRADRPAQQDSRLLSDVGGHLFEGSRPRHPSAGTGPLVTHYLPTVNAILNATAAVLLVWAYWLIRHKQVQTHRKVMLAAFTVSCLFLVCYLVYHAAIGGSKHFEHTGAIRTTYLTILFT